MEFLAYIIEDNHCKIQKSPKHFQTMINQLMSSRSDPHMVSPWREFECSNVLKIRHRDSATALMCWLRRLAHLNISRFRLAAILGAVAQGNT